MKSRLRPIANGDASFFLIKVNGRLMAVASVPLCSLQLAIALTSVDVIFIDTHESGGSSTKVISLLSV